MKHYQQFVLTLGLAFACSTAHGVLFLTQDTKMHSHHADLIQENVLDMAAQDPDLETFVNAVQAAGLTRVLQGPGPFTIFAPNNEAFKKLGPNLLKPENKDTLRKILLYHITPGTIAAEELHPGPLPTADGLDLTISVSDSMIKVNNANIVQSDILGSNGAIQVIDTVLLPPIEGDKVK